MRYIINYSLYILQGRINESMCIEKVGQCLSKKGLLCTHNLHKIVIDAMDKKRILHFFHNCLQNSNIIVRYGFASLPYCTLRVCTSNIYFLCIKYQKHANVHMIRSVTLLTVIAQ